MEVLWSYSCVEGEHPLYPHWEEDKYSENKEHKTKKNGQFSMGLEDG